MLLQKSYPEVWATKIEPHYSRIRNTPFAGLEEVNIVGRYDQVTGESHDPRYVSLQRLLLSAAGGTEELALKFDSSCAMRLA